MELNLPPFDIKVVERNGKTVVFDPQRTRYVALTPEEWVRQHFVNYLIHHKHYPSSRVLNEYSITLYKTSKRCDTVILGLRSVPLAIVEYKSPQVEITPQVFEQISRYNVTLKVKYLIVTNGVNHYAAQVDYVTQTISFLPHIPDYEELSTPDTDRAASSID